VRGWSTGQTQAVFSNHAGVSFFAERVAGKCAELTKPTQRRLRIAMEGTYGKNHKHSADGECSELQYIH
jgi:hypothetical protein